MNIELNFNGTCLQAHLFDTEIGRRLFNILPVNVELQTWGNESYGSIGVDLGEENPIPVIPDGGIAYTNQGNYLCLFYGQRPAWPVEHVGEILGGQWEQLQRLKPRSVQVIAVSK